MQFTTEIRRILFGLLMAFGLVALQAAYLAVVGPNTIAQRQENGRLIDTEAGIRRGAIVDRDGTPLVETSENEDGTLSRTYFYPAMNSALGYFSLRFGVGGAEAAFDDILRGDDIGDHFTTDLANQLLHRPQQGSDIRLTVDLDIQQQLVDAMRDHTGAAVVISVPDGEILAMVSLPTFNPNTLDDEWDNLRESPDNPFFNRAIQSTYQPGGMMETILIASAITEQLDLDSLYADATTPVQITDATLECAVIAPNDELTLIEAYSFACPAAFLQLADNLDEGLFEQTVNNFRINHPAMLSGFVFEDETQDDIVPLDEPQVTGQEFDLNTLGQGKVTVAPLRMAMIAAAILNNGNAPQPFALLEIQRPSTTEWIAASPNPTTIAMTTAVTARQLQTFMYGAVRGGAAQSAAQAEFDIGGHASLAHSGEGTSAWFIGFIHMGNNQGAAVAIVLENSDSVADVSRIGGTALKASAALFQDNQA